MLLLSSPGWPVTIELQTGQVITGTIISKDKDSYNEGYNPTDEKHILVNKKKDLDYYIYDKEEEDDCDWVTVNGAKICIGSDGKIAKGPSDLIGKSPDELGGGDKGNKVFDKHFNKLTNQEKNTFYNGDIKSKVEISTPPPIPDLEKPLLQVSVTNPFKTSLFKTI